MLTFFLRNVNKYFKCNVDALLDDLTRGIKDSVELVQKMFLVNCEGVLAAVLATAKEESCHC